MLFTRDGVWEVSWSRLSKFMECKQKAKLYAEKRGETDKPSRNFLPGRIIDLVCRTWLDNPYNGTMTELLDWAFEACIKEIKDSEDEMLRWRNGKDKSEVYTFCHNALVGLEPILEAKVRPFEYTQAQWFRTKIRISGIDGEPAEINLIGEKDIVVYSSGDEIVYDLKGTGNKDYWKKCIGQMVFYDLETFARTGKPPESVGIIQPAVTPNFVPIQVDAPMRQKLLSDIVAMYHATQKNEFPTVRNSSACSVCECKIACPKFDLKNLKL